MKIPSKVTVGGQTLKVELLESIEGSKLGKCCVAGGWIKIAEAFDGIKQSDSSKMNTFMHELVHAICDTMGRGDLSADEVFVNLFAGFLTEAYYSAEYKE